MANRAGQNAGAVRSRLRIGPDRAYPGCRVGQLRQQPSFATQPHFAFSSNLTQAFMASLLLQLPPLRSHAFVAPGVGDELSLPVELAAGRAFSLAPQAASSRARAEPRIFIVASYGQGEASIFDVG